MQPLGYVAIFAGALLLIAALKGSTIASVAKGEPDHAHGEPFGQTGGTAAPATATSSNGSSGSWRSRQRQLAAAHGWSLADWNKVIQLESGGDPNNRNASSGAYGIGQFLPSNRQQYPKAFSSNPVDQIEAMAAYIRDRYGTPTAALTHENQFHWY